MSVITRRTRVAATAVAAGLALALTALPAATALAADDPTETTEAGGTADEGFPPAVAAQSLGLSVGGTATIDLLTGASTGHADGVFVGAEVRGDYPGLGLVVPEAVVDGSFSVTVAPIEPGTFVVDVTFYAWWPGGSVDGVPVTATLTVEVAPALGLPGEEPAEPPVEQPQPEVPTDQQPVEQTSTSRPIGLDGTHYFAPTHDYVRHGRVATASGASVEATGLPASLVTGATPAAAQAGSTVTVTSDGVLYAPAPGFTGWDAVTWRNAAGAATFILDVVVSAPGTSTAVLPAGANMEGFHSVDDWEVVQATLDLADSSTAYWTLSGATGGTWRMLAGSKDSETGALLSFSGDRGATTGHVTVTAWGVNGASVSRTYTVTAAEYEVVGARAGQIQTNGRAAPAAAPGVPMTYDIVLGVLPAQYGDITLEGFFERDADGLLTDTGSSVQVSPSGQITYVPGPGAADVSGLTVEWHFASAPAESWFTAISFGAAQVPAVVAPITVAPTYLTWAGSPVEVTPTFHNEAIPGLPEMQWDPVASSAAPVTVESAGAGTFTVTPTPGYTGVVPVTFVGSDSAEFTTATGGLETDTVTVYVVVLGPVALDREVSFPAGQSATVEDLDRGSLWGSVTDLHAAEELWLGCDLAGVMSGFPCDPVAPTGEPGTGSSRSTSATGFLPAVSAGHSQVRLVLAPASADRAVLGGAVAAASLADPLGIATFVGDAELDGLDARLASDVAQRGTRPFALVTDGGIMGAQAMITATVTDGDAPVVSTPETAPEVPVDPDPATPVAAPGEVATVAREPEPEPLRFETGVPDGAAGLSALPQRVAALPVGSQAGLVGLLLGAAGLAGLGLRRRRAQR